MSDESKSKSNKSVVGAGAAGAGSGTLIVMLANHLPPNSAAKDILITSAPTLAVTISAVTTFCISKIKDHLKNKELKKVMEDAKISLTKNLKNPETSTEHKNSIRKRLEQLEELEVDSKLQSVKKLMKSDVSNLS